MIRAMIRAGVALFASALLACSDSAPRADLSADASADGTSSGADGATTVLPDGAPLDAAGLDGAALDGATKADAGADAARDADAGAPDGAGCGPSTDTCANCLGQNCCASLLVCLSDPTCSAAWANLMVCRRDGGAGDSCYGHEFLGSISGDAGVGVTACVPGGPCSQACLQ